MKKRILSLVLALLMLITVIPFGVIGASAEGVTPTELSGTGTKTDPYVISTPAEWATFAAISSLYDFSGKYVVLGADLDFEGFTKYMTATGTVTVTNGVIDYSAVDFSHSTTSVAAIVARGSSFQGTFDGKGYTIKGLDISAGEDIALFYKTANAIITNLTVEDCNFTATTSNYVAPIAARVVGNSTFSNITVKDSVIVRCNSAASSRMGGIVADITRSGTSTVNFDNCVSESALSFPNGSTNNSYIGGIFGDSTTYAGNADSTSASITINVDNCAALNKMEYGLSSTPSGFMSIGGIAGEVSVNAFNVTNCIVDVDVKVNWLDPYTLPEGSVYLPSIGGVVGVLGRAANFKSTKAVSSPKISDCYVDIDVSGTAIDAYNVGTVIGSFGDPTASGTSTETAVDIDSGATGGTPATVSNIAYEFTKNGADADFALTGQTPTTAITATAIDEAIVSASYSLTLGEDIGMNFYIDASDTLKSVLDAKMTLNSPVTSNKVTNFADAQINGRYFVFRGHVPAKYVNDTISADLTLSLSGGYTYSIWSADESVANYKDRYLSILNKQESPDAALVELLKETVKYGQAASDYFGGKTVTQMSVLDSVFNSFTPNVTDSSSKVNHFGISLLFESKVSLRHYFQLASGVSADSLVCTVDGTAATLQRKGTSDLYYIEIDNIAAKDLDVEHTVNVDGCVATASALSYGNAVLAADSATDDLLNTMKALYLYNKAASSYFEGSDNDSSDIIDSNFTQSGNELPLIKFPDENEEEEEEVVVPTVNALDYTFVFSNDTSKYTSDAKEALLKNLKAKYGNEAVTVVTDNGSDVATKEVLIGTGISRSSAPEGVDSTDAWYYVAVVGDKIVINASKPHMLPLAVDYFITNVLGTSTKNGELTVPETLNKTVIRDNYYSTDSSWELIPAYDGTSSGYVLYENNPSLTDTSASIKMYRVAGATSSGFNTYINTLKSFGFEVENSTDLESNKYATLSDGVIRVHVYYTDSDSDSEKTVRIIIDEASVSPEDFSYTTENVADGQGAQFWLYGINQEPGGWNGSSDYNPEQNVTGYGNAGQLQIIKCADNTVIIIDGGTSDQLDLKQFDRFLHQITGTDLDEKITISAWYFTHPDGDHIGGATSFLKNYSHKYELQRVISNFYYNTSDHSTSISNLATIIRNRYPNCMELNAHAGQKIQISDVTIQVLYTHEDTVTAKGVPSIGSGSSFATNDGCIVSKFYTDDMSMLVLGDINVSAEAVIVKNFTTATLKSDITQMAHHGWNWNLSTIYVYSASDIMLFTQTKATFESAYGNAHQKNTDLVTHYEWLIENYAKKGAYYSGFYNATSGLVYKDGDIQTLSAPGAVEATVLSYNILGNDGSLDDHTDIQTNDIRVPKICTALKRSDADIICLQEVTGGDNFYTPITTALAEDGYGYVTFNGLSGQTQNLARGLVIAYDTSRFTLKESGYHCYSDNEKQERAFIWVMLYDKLAGKDVLVTNTHWSINWDENGNTSETKGDEWRTIQANELREFIEGKIGQDGILIAPGDYNCGTDSKWQGILTQSYYSNAVDGINSTLSGVDHCFVNLNTTEVVSVRKSANYCDYVVDGVTYRCSDHNPVYVKVRY